MGNPISVLHVIAGMNRGGAETLLMNIFRKVDKEKFKFSFLVHSGTEGHFDKEILELGGTIFRAENPKKNLKKYKEELRSILENKGIDVVHSHLYSFSGYILKVANDANVPVRIAHSHNIQDGYSKGIWRTLYRNYMRSLIKKNSTDFLACSKEACISLFGKSPEQNSRIKIIKNGIDISLFQLIDRENFRRDVISELELNEGSTMIGHVGSFTKQKNHKQILDIFQEYLEKDPNSYLILVGDGPLKGEIINKVSKENLTNNVIFLGIREDIPRLMAAFDLFLFPSLFEGLGIVLIEAQAAGTQCVVSDKVPTEADLNIDLLNFMSLDSTSKEWSERLFELKHKKSLDRNVIMNAINQEKYNIDFTVNELCKIYSQFIG